MEGTDGRNSTSKHGEKDIPARGYYVAQVEPLNHLKAATQVAEDPQRGPGCCNVSHHTIC